MSLVTVLIGCGAPSAPAPPRGSEPTYVVAEDDTSPASSPSQISSIGVVNADATLASDLPGDLFGLAVSSGPDADRDGRADIMVAAPYADHGPTAEAGVVLLVASSTLAASGFVYGESRAVGTLPHLGRALAGASGIGAISTSESAYLVDSEGAWTDHPVSDQSIAHLVDPTPDPFIGLAFSPDADGDGVEELSGVIPSVLLVYAANLVGDHSIDDAWLSVVADVPREMMSGSVNVFGDYDGDSLSDPTATLVQTYYSNGGVYIFLDSPHAAVKTEDADVHVNAEVPSGVICAGSLGDLDADGKDDLGLGAMGSSPYETFGVGRVYGWVQLPGNDTSLTDADLVLVGEFPGFGVSVTPAGDVDADGNDDLLVGADPSTEAANGLVYLVPGPLGPGTYDVVDVASLRISGESGRQIGYAVAAAGDLDGDGTDDFVLGGPAYGDGLGAAYIFLGPR